MKPFLKAMMGFVVAVPFVAGFIGNAYAEHPQAAKFEPPDGKTLLVVGQDNATIESYLKESGRPVPAGFMLYTNITEFEGLDAPSRDYGSGTMFADALFDKYPGTVLQLGLYMVDSLADTAKGKNDAAIDHFAAWCKKKRVPTFLRIGYEFDGSHNHHDPEEYKAAYRHLVDRLRAAGVDNVAYVWHAHAHVVNSPIEKWYPGDDYVDWVGISYFSQHQGVMKPAVAFAKAKGKPLMIGEATPQGQRTSSGEAAWKAWYKRFFAFVEANDVKMVSYINSNWEAQPMWIGQNWGDARVQANAFVKNAWAAETSKDRYLHAADR